MPDDTATVATLIVAAVVLYFTYPYFSTSLQTVVTNMNYAVNNVTSLPQGPTLGPIANSWLSIWQGTSQLLSNDYVIAALIAVSLILIALEIRT